MQITREQAIAIAAREYDPSGKFEGGQYAAREHLGHWEVQVRSRYLVGPLFATIEVDGTTGDVLSSIVQEL